MPLRFVAIGDVMLDLTVAGFGHEASISVSAGGSALNAAMWAAACGAEATVVGRVGDDLAGRALRGHIEGLGIGAELTVDGGVTTGTFALVDGAVRVDRGANAGLWETPSIPAAEIALVSGYLPDEAVSAVLDVVEAPCIALGLGRLRHVPNGVDVVLANAREAMLLTGKGDVTEAARQLSAGVRLGCVTDGSAGAVAVDLGSVAVAQPSERHQGTARGAGDAFAAAFLLALSGGAGLQGALERGCEVGARAAGANANGQVLPGRGL